MQATASLTIRQQSRRKIIKFTRIFKQDGQGQIEQKLAGHRKKRGTAEKLCHNAMKATGLCRGTINGIQNICTKKKKK